MLESQLAALLGDDDAGLAAALDLVAGFDETLLHGVTRSDPTRAAALTAFAESLAVTPLGDRVAEAAAKVATGSVSDEYLAALAAGRAALTGAVHDALLARADDALGRERAAWPAGAASRVPSDGNLLAGCRTWLTELAVTGWLGVDHDLVSGSGQAIGALLPDPARRRLAVLLDGLAAELRGSVPVATMDRPPTRRWADLWTRAMLLAMSDDDAVEPEEVSGRLLVLGVDVHEHGTAFQIQVHGVLEAAGDGPSRLVRASVAATKVDTIVGPNLWNLLSGHRVLLGALAERRVLELSGMRLLASGDLIWDEEKAAAGEPVDPFATARLLLAGAVAPAVPPLDRHPVRIAEPVFIEGYKVDKATGSLKLGDQVLAVDTRRLPSCTPLTPQLVAASTACIGLLRADAGRWNLQPLAVQAVVKKKPTDIHSGDWALGPTDPKAAKAATRHGDPVAVLRERAGKLLRK